jgi:hypothetical protein
MIHEIGRSPKKRRFGADPEKPAYVDVLAPPTSNNITIP